MARHPAHAAAFGPVAQREGGLEDEDPLQARAAGPAQHAPATAPLNDTGMPNQLKAGIEALSGMDMSDVRVHRNSDQPAQLNALAYAQGSDIHLAPGQEQHLPHEAWHVVQQRQGRVQATVQMAGLGVNDDVALEGEADVMGERAASGPVQLQGDGKRQDLTPSDAGPSGAATIQLRRGRLDAAKVPRDGQVPLDDGHFGGLIAPYRGLHITLLPGRAGGNTVHITAYELPNPGAGGARSYNWFNPVTGVWEGWTNGNPLTTPGTLGAMLTFVESVVDHYLEDAVVVQAPLQPSSAMPTLGAKTPEEIAKETRAAERELRRQAEAAEKRAAREKERLLKQQAQIELKEKLAAQAKAAEAKAAAEREAQRAREEKERLAQLHAQQLVEYAEDIALGMNLADMYGWNEATVFEMAIHGDFREQVEARNSVGETPSYIS